MLELVIGEKSKPIQTDRLLKTLKHAGLQGTLYIGYPIMASVDETIFIDALITCIEYGVIVIDIYDGSTSESDDSEFWENIEERQDDLYIAIYDKLIKQKELREKKELRVPIYVITFLPEKIEPIEGQDVLTATENNLLEVISGFNHIQKDFSVPINAAIQRISTIKPTKKRDSVKRKDSKGAILKEIEKEIANLDQWQKKAAIESPEGPQRIRGLAGSGKTVALALKAAYLHASNPEWNIAITFHTRSLYQQFKDLLSIILKMNQIGTNFK